MKNFLFIFVCILLFVFSQAAKAGDAFPVNEQTFPALIVLQDKNGIDSGSGSGFFLQESNGIYLVTARHVFCGDGENTTMQQPRARVSTYSNNKTNSIKLTFTFDLESMYAKQLIKIGTNHDVAAALVANVEMVTGDQAKISFMNLISRDAPPDANVNTFGGEFLGGYTNVAVGNDVYVFGYPLAIGLKNSSKIDYDRPLLRKGIVAQKYEKGRTLVIDAPAYPGNSGGPVVTVTRNAFRSDYTIIGIVTEEIPYVDSWTSTRHQGQARFLDISNSGYSVVEPLDAVLELIRH